MLEVTQMKMYTVLMGSEQTSSVLDSREGVIQLPKLRCMVISEMSKGIRDVQYSKIRHRASAGFTP